MAHEDKARAWRDPGEDGVLDLVRGALAGKGEGGGDDARGAGRGSTKMAGGVFVVVGEKFVAGLQELSVFEMAQDGGDGGGRVRDGGEVGPVAVENSARARRESSKRERYRSTMK